MSKSYNIEIKLRADYSREDIAKIIQRGLDAHATFYNEISVPDNGKYLSLNSTLDRIFNESRDKQDFGPRLCMFYKNEWFFLFFYSQEGVNLYVGYPGVPSHMKIYKDSEQIDFSYYIKVLLDLVEDFPVHALKTEIWY